MLGRADPLAADLDHVLGPLADRVVESAAADAVARFEHNDVEPGSVDGARRREPREARADDDYIAVRHEIEYPASGRKRTMYVRFS